jgi:hypothetical protein
MQKRSTGSLSVRLAEQTANPSDEGVSSAALSDQRASPALDAFVRELAVSVARDAFAEAANATSGRAKAPVIND